MDSSFQVVLIASRTEETLPGKTRKALGLKEPRLAHAYEGLAGTGVCAGLHHLA